MDACGAGISGFIMGNIAQASADGFNLLGMYDLGAAVHAFTDMGSPWQTGGDGSPLTWSLSLNPETWPGALMHGAGEGLIAGILNSQAFGQAIAQSVLNAEAAFGEAFPGQYAAATSGFLAAVNSAAWSGIVMNTGAFPSTIMLNEVVGCLQGNPAACPGGDDFAFMGFLGGGGDSNYLGYVLMFGRAFPVK